MSKLTFNANRLTAMKMEREVAFGQERALLVVGLLSFVVGLRFLAFRRRTNDKRPMTLMTH